MRKQNPSLLSRIPLPVMVGAWLVLVGVGVVLVLQVLLKPANTPATATPIATAAPLTLPPTTAAPTAVPIAVPTVPA